VLNQQIHGSKRSLRSVENFTEFEQRTAYLNGDQIHAAKKGMNILDRIQLSHMAQMQNMFDFPPAPKLNPTTGRLNRPAATASEVRGGGRIFRKRTVRRDLSSRRRKAPVDKRQQHNPSVAMTKPAGWPA
jgi:hypothetical protein